MTLRRSASGELRDGERVAVATVAIEGLGLHHVLKDGHWDLEVYVTIDGAERVAIREMSRTPGGQPGGLIGHHVTALGLLDVAAGRQVGEPAPEKGPGWGMRGALLVGLVMGVAGLAVALWLIGGAR